MYSHKTNPLLLLATGVQSDCDQLIRRFVDSNILRYTEFSKIWREMKMPLMFYGREFERDLIELTDEMLYIAKCYWLTESDIQTQIGGLYLLYGFFMKQPNRVKRKIRVTPSDWIICRAFVDYVVDNSHWDTLHVFRELLAKNAFLYVFTSKEPHPESMAESRAQKTIDGPYRSQFKNHLTNYYNEESKDLEDCHNNYLKLKNDVMQAHFHRDGVSVNVADKEIFDKIRRIVNDFTAAGSNHLGADQSSPVAYPDDIPVENSSEDEETGDIGIRRALLKSKIFSAALKLGHRHQHNDVQTVSRSDPVNDDGDAAFAIPSTSGQSSRPKYKLKPKFTSDTEGSSSDDDDVDQLGAGNYGMEGVDLVMDEEQFPVPEGAASDSVEADAVPRTTKRRRTPKRAFTPDDVDAATSGQAETPAAKRKKSAKMAAGKPGPGRKRKSKEAVGSPSKTSPVKLPSPSRSPAKTPAAAKKSVRKAVKKSPVKLPMPSFEDAFGSNFEDGVVASVSCTRKPAKRKTAKSQTPSVVGQSTSDVVNGGATSKSSNAVARKTGRKSAISSTPPGGKAVNSGTENGATGCKLVGKRPTKSAATTNGGVTSESANVSSEAVVATKRTPPKRKCGNAEVTKSDSASKKPARKRIAKVAQPNGKDSPAVSPQPKRKRK